jgi:WD40 repeat protein
LHLRGYFYRETGRAACHHKLWPLLTPINTALSIKTAYRRSGKKGKVTAIIFQLSKLRRGDPTLPESSLPVDGDIMTCPVLGGRHHVYVRLREEPIMRKILILIAFIGLNAVTRAADAQETNLPPDREPITVENVGQLERVLVFGEPLTSYLIIDWYATGHWMVATGASRKQEFTWGIVLYDLDRLMDYTALIEPAHNDTKAAFVPGGPLLAVTGTGELGILDIRNGALKQVITGDVKFGPFEWSRDGRMIASTPNLEARSFEDATGDVAFVLDAESGELIGTVGYPYSGGLVSGSMLYHFTPDGTALITILGSRPHLWDISMLGNYRDPLLISKSEYINQLEALRYTPDNAPHYTYTVFKNDAGRFALWLASEDGSALFSTQDGNVTTVTPNESGEGPYNEAGVPTALESYTQLSKPDVLKALSEVQSLTFITLDAPVQLLDMRQAAAVVQRWRYDPDIDTMLDQQTGRLYTAVEDEETGQFIDDEGTPVRDTPYYVGDKPAPDELVRFEDMTQLIFSPDGKSVAAIGRVHNEGPGIRLLDYATGEELVALENAPKDVYDTIERYYSFHPGGHLLAAYINRTIFIWDTQTGGLLKTIETPDDETGVSFSADGTLLVTGGTQLHFYAITSRRDSSKVSKKVRFIDDRADFLAGSDGRFDHAAAPHPGDHMGLRMGRCAQRHRAGMVENRSAAVL